MVTPTHGPARVVRRELWHVDVARCAGGLDAIEAALPRLAADECGWARDGQSAIRRATRIALRLLLERFIGPDEVPRLRGTSLPIAPKGRPLLPAGLPPIAFSLAHSGSDALIAIATQGPIGVDLEHPRSLRMSAARRAQMIAAARTLGGSGYIPDTDPDRALLMAWTRLEAIGKARGTGVAAVLADFGIVARGGVTTDVHDATAGREPDARHQRSNPAGLDELVAYDLAMAAGIVAAIALPPEAAPPPLIRLPAGLEHLAALANPTSTPASNAS